MTLSERYGCKTIDEVVAKAGKLADGDPENGVGQEPDKAMAIYNDVLLESPDHPGCLYGVGIVLREAGRYAQAIQIAKRVAEVKPKDPRGWKLLATIYGEMSRYDESIRYAERALSCSRTDYTLADYAYAHCNAGNWKVAAGACDEALQYAADKPSGLAREAINNARVTKAYCDLALGKWEEGFKGFRYTMRTKFRKERVYNGPDGPTQEWYGQPDAKLIITGEQGLGDEIMAASMIPDIKVPLIFDCDHRLAPLFARSFPGVVISPTRREAAVRSPFLPTHHKTLFGLGEVVRQKDEDFPRKPFLLPNQAYVDMFREYFGGQKVIGLAWSGGLPRTGMTHRQAGLSAFLPLVRRGEAEFVSLQYKDDADEVRSFEAQHGLRVHRLPWATMAHDNQDVDLLAALIASMDEVVSVGTTVAHISSALGVPTTILVNRGLGWVFAQPELLWYPASTKLWRKTPNESWRDCVARLVETRK